MIITEKKFKNSLVKKLKNIDCFKSVSGPGRSGAIAAVYASHYLGIPFIMDGRNVPNNLRPHLVIDTARKSGKTLKKAIKKSGASLGIAIYEEPPRVKFWYEKI